MLGHEFSDVDELFLNDDLFSKSIVWSCDCGFRILFIKHEFAVQNSIKRIAEFFDKKLMVLDLLHYNYDLVLEKNEHVELEVSRILQMKNKYPSHKEMMVGEIMTT